MFNLRLICTYIIVRELYAKYTYIMCDIYTYIIICELYAKYTYVMCDIYTHIIIIICELYAKYTLCTDFLMVTLIKN